MTECCDDVIQEVSAMLAEVIQRCQPDWENRARDIDALVRIIVREVGRQTVESLLNVASLLATEAARSDGLRVERRPTIRFFSVFGSVEVESPYLYDAATRRSSRPVKNRWGITVEVARWTGFSGLRRGGVVRTRRGTLRRALRLSGQPDDGHAGDGTGSRIVTDDGI